MTAIDRYALISILLLIVLSVWHAIIGTIIFTRDYADGLSSSSRWTWTDRYTLIGIFSLYLLVHIVLIMRQWYGPIAKRKEMVKRDSEYHQLVKKMESKRKKTTNFDHSTKRYETVLYLT